MFRFQIARFALLASLLIGGLNPLHPAAQASPAGMGPLPANATPEQIVACVEARTAYNFKAYTGYTFRVTSIRQGYTMDGKLTENFKVVKLVSVTPQGRTEKFEKGEKNGQSATMDDFWMEKLGLSKKYNAEAMNLFTAANHGRYDFVLRGVEQQANRTVFKLAFKVKKEGSQELQKGMVTIDGNTCGVMKATGNFPKVWVTQDTRAELTLAEIKPGLWLPVRQDVDLEVDMSLMKRKGKMIDEFATYQIRPSN